MPQRVKRRVTPNGAENMSTHKLPQERSRSSTHHSWKAETTQTSLD